ncbi:2-succinyl-5-enolpyruvyl-6-hydroxy-3-cyclohexene-1-carboxylic-acid synthase [Paenimyroides aestuarii]|uniref:2-succinyl-5-enolpyruvyl-6-hydroxy-3-cyclohexene-1-carboxylate synthase n=1 Tax=Paenimyroides aestuarii TaxID=2968490 RepID=A0ABY5NR15_9FLAO|nr:2-succinyl-5-enolpyruvyl-6-hydroxy-3-cyclohexene-1-carboxylic-acid synthase [Paenimyroides aestuarii]UUV20908.1 2-succinyl-5-enolpyruvyl-6-hydroxy-3-cyclohexene-1-carboxylic-acid synthase [Paenimyroides aestuarii]
MNYPEIPLAQSILQLFKAKEIKHIIISPGSRNAPLTIGFTNDSFFTCYSIVDERCAAFFALGIAQQTLQPAAVLCTSGSALLNYYPAVTEAFYSQIPLIVVSADRPTSKIDIGDGQTIRQRNVFENHSLFNANLSDEASVANDELIQNAIAAAKNKKGPVHINVPFEEPLYNLIHAPTYQATVIDIPQAVVDSSDFKKVFSTIENANKIVVLIGAQNPNAISKEHIDYLANLPNVLLLTESNSNVHHARVVANIDTLITTFSEEQIQDFQPDVLLTFGGMIVSKRIKALFRKHPPAFHWHIDELRAYDTFGVLTDHLVIAPNDFIDEMKQQISAKSSSYADSFLQTMQRRREKHNEYVASIPFSDLKSFGIIWNHLPQNIQLQISNSAVIRYAQLFETHQSIDVYCNRGTSGIDGSTSTAIGAAVATQQPVVFLTGDISFFYDSNALWNNYIPKNFKIIIINNSGGGIFRILPGHQENNTFNTFFETEHHLTAEHLAKMYQFDYLTAKNEEELNMALKLLFSNDSHPQILEIFTPSKINRDLLRNYFTSIS